LARDTAGRNWKNDQMTTQGLRDVSTITALRPLQDVSNTIIDGNTKDGLKKKTGLGGSGNAANRLPSQRAKKQMMDTPDNGLLQVYEDDHPIQKKRESGGQSRKKPARYGDWFDGDDAELEKMVDEFNDEQQVEKDDVARHVQQITDGLCSQLDLLIDENELDGNVNEQSLREKLLKSWEGKSYYDRLLQMAGSSETTSTLIQKSLENKGIANSDGESPRPLLSPPKRKNNNAMHTSRGINPPLIPEQVLPSAGNAKPKLSVAVNKRPAGPGLLKVSARGAKPTPAPWENTAGDKHSSASLKKDVAQQQEALAGVGKRAHDGLSRLCCLKKEATLQEAIDIEKEFRAMEIDVQKIISLSRQLANQITVGKANASVLVKSLKKKAAQ
jgi:hypothetical protein